MADIKNLNNQQLIQNGGHLANQINSEKDLNLRMNVLHIFYDLIAELENEGTDFKQIQSKLVDKLDASVIEHKCDDDFRQTFITLLYDKINVMDKPWREKGILMIQNLTKLTDLLIDYRLVLNEPDSQHKQMTCIANLLHFYKNRIYKKELYVKYIYKLYDLHVQAENYTEIGFTLLLHADLFSWAFNPIKEFIIVNDNQVLNQSTSGLLEWQRKEQLYLKIIEYFEKGKCYEEGIVLLKEMELFFEKHFEYYKLSNIIKKKANFYDCILTQFRFEPEYFRVGFFGIGFPLFLRNRMFVYKGNDFEKIGDFINRIKNEYPKAEIITGGNPIDEEFLKSNKLRIQIVTVKPIPDLPPDLESQQELNEKVCAYYLTNKVDTFLYDRPIVKQESDSDDKDNEFKSLWCERTILKIEKKLPDILRWFEVIDRKVYQLTPVEAACDTIENSIKELKKLIKSYSYEPNKQLTPLTMRLQGVIDASVNGGLRKYQEAFFSPSYIESHSNYYHHIKRLKKLVFNQINLLENGLAVHKRLVPPSLLPLHELLVEKFSQMRNSFIQDSSYIVDLAPPIDKKSSKILNTPLPPIPPIQHRLSTSSSPTIQFRNSREFQNGNNSSEDDLYSYLEDKKLTARQSLSPSSMINLSNPSSSSIRHKSLNGLQSNTLTNGGFSATVPYDSTLSLSNGNNQIINRGGICLTVNGHSQFINSRSNSMPRNNMQFNSSLSSSPFDNNQNYPPVLPPRSSQIINHSKSSPESQESGIETDFSETTSITTNLSSKPILPKRSSLNKKPLITNLDEPTPSKSINISIDIDKNKPSVNTVISSNSSYIEDSSNSSSLNLSDVPPPLPKKSNRLPTSKSTTTIINVNNYNDLDTNLITNHHTSLFNNNNSLFNTSLMNNQSFFNSSLINNCNLNGNLNNSLKSTSSSSSNEYTETHVSGNVTTTTISTNSSSHQETISRQIQNLGINN